MLFSTDGEIAKDAFTGAFRRHIAMGVKELQPYDCRRLTATCYFQVGVPSDRLQVFGGWTTDRVLRKSYVEASFQVPGEAVHLFQWLAEETGVRTTT